MKNTNQIEKTAKAAIWIMALILGSTICKAQTAPAAKISPDFSKAAILALVAVHTDATGNAAETHKALVEAEAAAASPAEEGVVKQLKNLAFGNLTAMMDLQTCSMLNMCKPRDTGKADTCYTAWKASLRNLDAAQPIECK